MVYNHNHPSKRRFFASISIVLFLFLFLLSSPSLLAQENEQTGENELVKSMGFPQAWKPYVGGLFNWDQSGGRSQIGGEFHFGISKDLMNPIFGMLSLEGEGYVGTTGGRADGGLRLLGAAKIIFFHAGVDYSFRTDEVDFMMSFAFPLLRGGLFGTGGDVRIDYIPKRGPTFRIGLSIPIFQPYAGKTRPKKSSVRLPKAQKSEKLAYIPPLELEKALQNIRESADWINRFTTPFFDQQRKTDEEHLAHFREKMKEFKEHIQIKNDNFPDGRTYEAEINFYHHELERAFALAVGNSLTDDGKKLGQQISAKAREILFAEIILPYNRLLGQRKVSDTLYGYGRLAEAIFRKWIHTSMEISPNRLQDVKHVFHSLIQYMEDNRAGSRKHWEDSRLVWLPMHYAFRLEDHDTQDEIDAVIEKAIEEEFTTGNDVHYVINEKFHWELARMILNAEDYHVLWIHDYKGINAAGRPDNIAYRMALEAYLRALIERIKVYDETGKIPVYMIFLDQHYFEINKGRLWLELLENPLERTIELPTEYQEWEKAIRTAQDELRQAVAASRKLQAGAKRYGKTWLHNKVKVHINITNPSDLSFRDAHLFKFIFFAPDNMLRDHRKLAFYDATELNPEKGEAIYTGVGVGEHYVGPTWEDRSILVRGPSLIALKDAARELLLSQGFKEHEIPPPLRPFAKPDNYDEMLESLVAKHWNATAAQAHNFTGFGPKPANLAKAVLYNLMPKGSHFYVPDSLWNSPFWAGMMVGAALRGCWVLVVSPSYANAPSDAAMTISRTNEIFTRFVAVQNEMKEEIEAAGGMLKTGIYNLDVDVSDQSGRTKIIEQNFKRHDWLHKVFPFHSSVFNTLENLTGYLEAQGLKPVYLTDDKEKRKPKLHLKSQFFASANAISSLIPLEGWGKLVSDYVVGRAEQITSEAYIDVKKLRTKLSENARPLIESWWNTLSKEEQEKAIFYLTVGSHNQDYRSKIMDGEVLYIVSHIQAMIAYLDFVNILGVTTWVENIEQLEKLIPRFGGFWYKIGRYLKLAI